MGTNANPQFGALGVLELQPSVHSGVGVPSPGGEVLLREVLNQVGAAQHFSDVLGLEDLQVNFHPQFCSAGTKVGQKDSTFHRVPRWLFLRTGHPGTNPWAG